LSAANPVEKMLRMSNQLTDKLMPLVMHVCNDQPAIVVMISLQEMAARHAAYYIRWLLQNGKTEEAEVATKIFEAGQKAAKEVVDAVWRKE